jgi:hypothetical protein
VCARAQAQIDAGDLRGAQHTLLPVARAVPDDPLPFRLLGEAFLRLGDAHRAERALSHARTLELARMDRGEDVPDRGTESWLHRARSLKKTQSMLGYRAVADTVAQSAPPASSGSGVREKVVEDAPLDEEDGVSLDVRLNNERRRARALEAQPTRRIAPPSELLEMASADPVVEKDVQKEPESTPMVAASEAEIEVLVQAIAEEQAQEEAQANEQARALALERAHTQAQAWARARARALEKAQTLAQARDARWVWALTVGTGLMLVASIVALLLALGFFR